MDTTRAWLDECLAHHRAGRLDEAARLYRAVLAVAPSHADCLHLLGLAHHQGGDTAGALVHLTAATRLRPEVGLFHANLGIALLAAGEDDQAAEHLQRACALAPDEPDSWHNLGLALLRLQRAAEAEAAMRRCLALLPDGVDARVNLGAALVAQGRNGAAEHVLRAALALQPDCVEALCGLAAALGPTADAVDCIRRAMQLRPNDPDLMTRLGTLFRDIGELGTAEAMLHAVVQRRPGDADALSNHGNVLAALGQTEAALRSFEAALALAPGHADAAYMRGSTLLLAGRLEAGWAGFEQRWERRGFAPPYIYSAPRWRGAADGKAVLLLHAEQGLGDTIQMARFVPRIAARQKVVLAVQEPLVRLLRAIAPGVTVVAQGGDLPPFDVQCPMMSLPHALEIGLADLPGEVPYLGAAPRAVASWRARLAALPGLRVGITWAGNASYAADHRRSLPEAALVALAGVAGVSFVSLQKGAAPPAALAARDWTAELRDMADTAALIGALDLVISADTAIAHLAGAMGKTVWLLNRFDTCWRWLLGRADSPWYPSLRQFRQPAPGAWDAVLADVRAALAQRAIACAATLAGSTSTPSPGPSGTWTTPAPASNTSGQMSSTSA